MTTLNGDNNNLFLRRTTPHLEKRLVREEQINEWCLPLSSMAVLKLKKKIFCVPLDFKIGLKIDAAVDLGAYVCAITHIEQDRIKQQTPRNIFKSDDPPCFQKQVAMGQLEEPLALVTYKYDTEDNTFREHFVVLTFFTRPFIVLNFMSHDSVVTDKTHGLNIFLTWQCRSRVRRVKQVENTSVSSLTIPWQYHSRQQKQSQPLLIIHQNGTQEVLQQNQWNSKIVDFWLNVNDNCQTTSNQVNQHNGITLIDKKWHRICRNVRSHSGATQFCQSSGHGSH